MSEPTSGRPGRHPVAGIAAAVAAARHPRWGPLLRAGVTIVAVPVVINAVFDRNPPLGIFLNGAVIGALYGLIAMGIVLVYRANHVINFAQASLGSAPAVAALILYQYRGWPYPAAIVAGLAGGAVAGGIVERVVIRRFRRSPRIIVTVATIGVAQLLSFVEFFTPKWILGKPLPTSQFTTPFSAGKREIGGVFFQGDHLVTLVAVLAAVLALTLFLRATRFGISIRAAAENPARAALLGVPVAAASTLVWVVAATLSSLVVLLRVPLVGLPMGSLIGPGLLLYAVTAGVVARMKSLPVAFAAGIVLGAVDQSVFYSTRNPNITTGIMFPVILAALLVQRRRLSRAEEAGASAMWTAVPEFRRIPSHLRRLWPVRAGRTAMWILAGALLIGAPDIVGEVRRNLASLGLLYAIVGISVVVLAGWAGQISLGQFAFAGIGAAVAGALSADAGADFFVSLLAAGLVGAALAVVVGLPALRIQGLFLAVTTLGFAGATQAFFLDRRYFSWLLPETANPVERPVLFERFDLSGDRAFYYACLAVLVLAVVTARSFRHSRSGRILVSVRDNPRAAQAYGINLGRTRLAAFAFSGFLAALAGGLYAFLLGAVDPGVFSPTASIQVFAMAVIGGLTSIGGAMAGAAYFVVFQYLLPDYQLLATGIGMLVLLLFFPGGLAQVAYAGRDRFLRRVAERRGSTPAGGARVGGDRAGEDVAAGPDLPAEDARRAQASVR